MDSEVFYKKYIERDFEEYYVPHLFENVCRQYLICKNKVGAITPVIENIGKYYYDNIITILLSEPMARKCQKKELYFVKKRIK